MDGDVKNLWAVDWLRWSGFSQFWGQLVLEHMRTKSRRELDMKTEVVGGRVHAVVDAFTADERFDNDMESKLVVHGPAPGGQRREFAMRQSAPGRYEAEFESTPTVVLAPRRTPQGHRQGDLRPAR